MSVVCSLLEECPEYQEWRDILVKCGFNKNDTVHSSEMPFIQFAEEKYKEVINLNYSLSEGHDFCHTGLSDKDLMRPLREIQFIVSRPNDLLLALDGFCITFFTLELIARFVVCPNRLELLKCLMTIIDLLYLSSRWGYVLTNTLIPVILDYDVSFVIHRVFQIFSCFRVLRIFQMARNVKGLKYFLLTLKASIPILALLLFVLLIFATVLVDMVRKVENLEHDGFQNISVGYWWALVTMSTVGYGDFYPVTVLGYAIGGLCVLLGPIIIAFFVPIVSGNFLLYYGYKERPIVPSEKLNKPVPDEKNFQTEEEKTIDGQCIYV